MENINLGFEVLGRPIIDRVLKLAEHKGVSKRQVLIECDLVGNSFTNWLARKTIPSVDAVIKFAEYFGVSADYLITGQEYMATQNALLSGKEKKLLEKFNRLDDKQQQVALDSLDLQLKYSSKANITNKQA